MSKRNKSGAPDAFEVAQRYAALMHDPDMQRILGGGRAKVTAGYAIWAADTEERPTERAMVRVAATPVDPFDRPEAYYGSVGQYDPIRGWIFYPEYVGRQGHRALAVNLERKFGQTVGTRNNLAASTDKRWLDLRHPITVRARTEMAALLQGLSVQALLDRAEPLARPGSHIPECDNATVVYPAIRTRFGSVDLLGIDEGELVVEVAPVQELALCISGLRHVKPDGAGKRVYRNLWVAQRTSEAPDVWLPTTEFVGEAEWNILAPVPDALIGYAERHSAFSAAYCAVAHNIEAPWMRTVT